MVRRIVGITLVVLGIAAVVLGILSATAWRTSEVVSATHESAEVPFVVVEPGVAGIVNDQVDITVTAAGADQAVTVIEGRDVDVEGWIGDLPYLAITGLADWENLTTELVEPDPADGEAAEGEDGESAESEEIPSPVGSDMWTRLREGEGTLEFPWFQPEDRTVLFIVRDGQEGAAPTVTFTWDREVSTPYVMPLVAGGTAAVVVGLILVVWSFLPSRRRSAEGEEDQPAHPESAPSEEPEAAESADADPVVSGDVGSRGTDSGGAAGPASPSSSDETSPGDPDHGPVSATTDVPTTAVAAPGAPRLTRRQLREMRRIHGEDASTAELEAIAAEIPLGEGAGAEHKPTTDAATDYPAWLRGESEESAGSSTLDGATAGEPRARVSIADASAWRRRWGVASSGEAAAALPGASDGQDADADATTDGARTQPADPDDQTRSEREER
ncbi:hypothetical protein [Serinibacter salmoneus]|uniref:Uncharacterized protein n=1 Tax=Serinibacter salmoneus TaxID=556530 RepID=A0A2A9D1Z1_9MICO|nr:hypothetical protein [Serinibacter salmoneus]PFG20275.1 hypothetical protein ATL40_1872 [Serinibacter salmoneus]